MLPGLKLCPFRLWTARLHRTDTGRRGSPENNGASDVNFVLASRILIRLMLAAARIDKMVNKVGN